MSIHFITSRHSISWRLDNINLEYNKDYLHLKLRPNIARLRNLFIAFTLSLKRTNPPKRWLFSVTTTIYFKFSDLPVVAILLRVQSNCISKIFPWASFIDERIFNVQIERQDCCKTRNKCQDNGTTANHRSCSRSINCSIPKLKKRGDNV